MTYSRAELDRLHADLQYTTSETWLDAVTDAWPAISADLARLEELAVDRLKQVMALSDEAVRLEAENERLRDELGVARTRLRYYGAPTSAIDAALNPTEDKPLPDPDAQIAALEAELARLYRAKEWRQ